MYEAEAKMAKLFRTICTTNEKKETRKWPVKYNNKNKIFW